MERAGARKAIARRTHATTLVTRSFLRVVVELRSTWADPRWSPVAPPHEPHGRHESENTSQVARDSNQAWNKWRRTQKRRTEWNTKEPSTPIPSVVPRFPTGRRVTRATDLRPAARQLVELTSCTSLSKSRLKSTTAAPVQCWGWCPPFLGPVARQFWGWSSCGWCPRSS